MTSLLSRLDVSSPAASENGASSSGGRSVADLEAALSDQGAVVKAAKAQAKSSDDDADAATAKDAVARLLELKDALAAAQAAESAHSIPTTASGQVDYAEDFFGRRAFLAVSGQLNGALRPRTSTERRCAIVACVRPTCSS